MEKLPVPLAKYAIPFSILSRVCQCEDPTWMTNAPYSWVNFCGKCEKPLRYLVEQCRGEGGCGEYYIRDFMHDGRCVRPRCQLCWDCFQKLGNHCPPEHGHRGNNWGDPIIIQPAGLNPKKFKPEELDNVFDF